MIKLPKEILKLVNTLETKGFATYAVGGCVRDSIAGKQPLDWDLATAARLEDLKELFPEAKVLNEKLSVVRIDYVTQYEDEDGNVFEDGIIVDIATFRKEGRYEKGKPVEVEFVDSIEEDLPRRDFTVNAIADSPGRGIVDPYGGRDDIKKRLIRTIGDADEKFTEDPIRMLRAITVCAESDFDLQKDTFDSISRNYHLLYDLDIAKIRNAYIRILAGEYAGKGLNMLAATGAMNAILTEEVFKKLNPRERKDFTQICKNVDKLHRVPERRMGVLFTCLSRKKALTAIKHLQFEEELEQHMIDCATQMEQVYFVNNELEMKKKLLELGWDRYEFVNNVAKAQRIIFDLGEHKITARIHFYNEIKRKHEPIFVEDLAIDANDLIEAGLCDDETVDKMLYKLTQHVHKNPNQNNRRDLLKRAKTYKKSKLIASTSGINWWR
ncbi:MAG: hypothetical protein MJ146_04665 [Clostridia bacterium]|nr:hypothetical protein [Clostridia bacterium]